MDIKIDGEKKLVIIYPSGILDMSTAGRLDEALRNEFQNRDGFNYIINMMEVESICSFGIQVLVNFSRLLREKNCELRITNANSIVRELFMVSNLDKLINIDGTERQALAALN